jgi:hypothetical protein
MARRSCGAANDICLLLCRFLRRADERAVMLSGLLASEKRQCTKSRDKMLRQCSGRYGDWCCARVVEHGVGSGLSERDAPT